MLHRLSNTWCAIDSSDFSFDFVDMKINYNSKICKLINKAISSSIKMDFSILIYAQSMNLTI